jgi:hypothetical protein
MPIRLSAAVACMSISKPWVGANGNRTFRGKELRSYSHLP